MGREISRKEFSDSDFAAFAHRVREETDLLRSWLDDGVVDDRTGCCGLELEGWLVDDNFEPAPLNKEFLGQLNHDRIVPELSRYNFEINSQPERWQPGLLTRLQQDLETLWHKCELAASRLGARTMMIGILPTVRNELLTMEQVSDQQRYLALNQQVLRLRNGQPLRIRIDGPRERLELEHQDVMAEAATTSLQMHLQVAPAEAARYYNAAQILAAPLVAISANSPCLFGHELWNETRIPLFEQAVMLASGRDEMGRLRRRVGFGNRYLRSSMMELFDDNIAHYPALLPVLYEEPERLRHMRLHNGTIWRWNRPLVGFSETGRPHLRIEFRQAPAGPTPVDTIANMAFMLGALRSLAAQQPAPESGLTLIQARENFYRAARFGLDCTVRWLDGRDHPLRTVVREQLLPAARQGLLAANLEPAEVAAYLDEVIAPRVASGRTGADWQRRYLCAHGADLQAMTGAYYQRQQAGLPVHRWRL